MKEREIVASDLQRSGYTQQLIPDCNGITGCLRGDHQYLALRGANLPSTEKHFLRKKKKKKWDRLTKTNSNLSTITVQTRRPSYYD
jgi:hypothetical protein